LMAESLVAAVRQPKRIQTQAEAGRQHVLQHYDWDSLANRLGDIWISSVRPGHARRAA
jgi:hypothetical protein